MPIQHKKEFGIYHWDTFDNETLLVGEANTLEQAIKKVKKRYKDRIRSDGADKVEIVDSKGNIRESFNIG
jgi:hypothetical protein